MLRIATEQEAVFRAEVAGWLQEHVPVSLRHQTFRPPPAEGMAWYRLLSERGWLAPHWPAEFGGMAATPVQQIILMEELARAGAPDIPTQGLNHIGPMLIARGTPLQQQRHLPAILSGDTIWCQGYSEPGAGSDLASLRTRADIRGDRLVINGHKIWTTWGHHAHWMFALVRTSTEPARQRGITFVLIDLDSPGITRRAITTIAGDDEFCEVFLDEVSVPLENVVGDIGDGWSVATAVLAEERMRLGAPAQAFKAWERLRRLCQLDPARDHADVLARAEIQLEVLVASYLNVAESEVVGDGIESSYLKILATETVQSLLDMACEVAGERAALRESVNGTDATWVDYSDMFLQSRRLSIYGGTNEIQRTLIAAKVLGMPSPPRSKT